MFFHPATVHFQSCTLNVNKIDVVLCFRKLICAFSLTCFKVRMCKIWDKSDTFWLNYSNLFRGPLFSGHSVVYFEHVGNRWQVATILILFLSEQKRCLSWLDTNSTIQRFLGFQRVPRTDGIGVADTCPVVATYATAHDYECSVKKLKTSPSHGVNTCRYLEPFSP